MTGAVPLKAKDYKSGVKPIWCPGCGHYAVLAAVTRALAQRLGRLAEPGEIADAIVYLASPGASYITGASSMVSPEMEQLSVFITPWMKPSCIQRAISAACRSTTAFSRAT